jgi:KDO2-lipid IV(A) lauroyltransferase
MYRSLNNQFIDNFLKKLRYRYSKLLFRKEKGEIKSAIKLFLQGYSIGMLIDQKHLQGDMINFFNIPAPTLMLPAKLAIEHNVPIIFITIVRIHHKYIIKFIHINPTDQPEQMMLQVNHELEKLITQHPQQWLWIHKRWSDDVYKDQ